MNKVVGLSILILLVLMACTIGSAVSPQAAEPGGQDPQLLVEQAISQTLAAQTQIARSVQETVDAMGAGLPAGPQPDIASAPGSPRVSVSVETNCRSGPGNPYEVLGVLRVGEEAEVIGRNASSDTWIIRLPSNPAVTCWLWGFYASLAGNPGQVPVIEPPPTPAPTIAPPGTASVPVTIVNNGSTAIFYVYISPTTSSGWGEDKLGTSTIAAGSSTTFYVSPGSYDIKVEDGSHSVLSTWMARDITGPVTLIHASSAPATASVTVVNNSPTTIFYLYVSPSTSSNWGEDRLGTSTIPSGGSFTVTVPAGSYDVKVEDGGHNPLATWLSQNLTGSVTLTYTP